MQSRGLSAFGVWQSSGAVAATDPVALLAVVARVREAAHIVHDVREGRIGVAFGGALSADGPGLLSGCRHACGRPAG